MAETKFRIDVYHHFGPTDVSVDAALKSMERRLMSALSDKIAEVSTSVDAAIERVQVDVADQQAKIADLERMVAQGTATQADLDALDALRAKVDALDPVKPDVLPADPETGPSPTE